MVKIQSLTTLPYNYIPCALCLVTQSRLILWNPTYCSPLGFSVHVLFQARILEWVAISYSRGSFWSRYQTWISCIGRWIFATKPPGKPNLWEYTLKQSPRRIIQQSQQNSISRSEFTNKLTFEKRFVHINIHWTINFRTWWCSFFYVHWGIWSFIPMCMHYFRVKKSMFAMSVFMLISCLRKIV